jgi:hypothetical protein
MSQPDPQGGNPLGLGKDAVRGAHFPLYGLGGPSHRAGHSLECLPRVAWLLGHTGSRHAQGARPSRTSPRSGKRGPRRSRGSFRRASLRTTQETGISRWRAMCGGRRRAPRARHGEDVQLRPCHALASTGRKATVVSDCRHTYRWRHPTTAPRGPHSPVGPPKSSPQPSPALTVKGRSKGPCSSEAFRHHGIRTKCEPSSTAGLEACTRLITRTHGPTRLRNLPRSRSRSAAVDQNHRKSAHTAAWSLRRGRPRRQPAR